MTTMSLPLSRSNLTSLLLGLALLFEPKRQNCHAFSPASIARPHHPKSRDSALPLSALSMVSNNDNQSQKVVIIGGGVAGLSAAYYIATKSSKHQVTLLEREALNEERTSTTAASFAAAGMLGVQQAEGFPNSSSLLELCNMSREMYDKWVEDVEEKAKKASSGKGKQYLWSVTDDEGEGASPSLEPWEVNFRPNQGLLTTQSEPKMAAMTFLVEPEQLNSETALELEPRLNPKFKEWSSFPTMATIDARRLTCSLRAACAEAGVLMKFGENVEALARDIFPSPQDDRTCTRVLTKNGVAYPADAVIVANGASVRQLLGNEVSVIPNQAQSLIMGRPKGVPPIQRGVCGSNLYVVPKADGRILVGATLEDFYEKEDDTGNLMGPSCTQSGLDSVFSNAKKLVPDLDRKDIEEKFAALRPLTPDGMPYLGRVSENNVYVAGGYNIYGLLIAPKAGQLLGDLVLNSGNLDVLSEEDKDLLDKFRPGRDLPKGDESMTRDDPRFIL